MLAKVVYSVKGIFSQVDLSIYCASYRRFSIVRSVIGLESTEETSEAESVGDDCIEAAESDVINEREELQERNLTQEQQAIVFRIKEALKSRTRDALLSLKVCDKMILQTGTSKVDNMMWFSTSNITDCNNLLCHGVSCQ